MTVADKSAWHSPLARRLILWVVLFSSAVTLVLTAIQLYREYRLDLGAIDEEFRQLERIQVPTLSQQVWTTDLDAVQLQLDSILGMHDLRYVEVQDDAGTYLHAGAPVSGDVIVREFALHHRHRGRDQQIGRLKAVVTLDGVYRRLLDSAFVALFSNAVKTFLVAGFMLVLFHRLVGRYLSGIARRAETLTLDNLDGSIELARARRHRHPPDELDALIVALNRMRQGLRQSHSALVASERRYRTLFEHAQDGIVIVVPESGRILDVNPSMAALAGYPRGELLGREIADLATPASRTEIETALRRVRTAGQARFESLLQRKDGHPIPVEISSRTVDLDERPILMSVVYDVSERRRIEAETTRLGRILDESSNEIYLFRADTLQFVRVNRGALENLGYSLDELRHKTPLDLKPEFTRETFEQLLYPLRRGSADQITFTTVHRRKDGSLYPIEARLHLSRREQPPVFVAIILDISERRQAEDAIEESRRKLESVVTSAPVVLWAVDCEGIFTLSEGKGLDQLGLAPGEVVGSSVFDVYRDHSDIQAQVRRALAGESFTAEVNIAALWFEVHYAPARDARGQMIGAMGVAVDITERRRAEAALRAERDFSSAVLDTVGSPVLVLDAEGRVVRFNRACEALSGYRFKEIEGRHVWELLIPEEQIEAVKNVFAGLTTGRGARRYENDWITRTGERRLLIWSNTNLLNSDGRVEFIIAAGVDITERRAAEAERERLLAELQARNAEMESFVYTVSHDLKNPLITIGGFANLLERDVTAGKVPQARDSIMEINRAVESLKHHIEDLLALSRAGHATAQPRPVRLTALVADVIAPMRERADALGATISVAADLPEVVIDEEGFRRVYANLIDNAIKYRRAGAALRIDVGWERRGECLLLYVRDNGVGIKPQYRERVFGLFQRLDTHLEGTGVGLAISKRVVEAHGGRMWVESEFDRGSTFWLSLPESVIVHEAIHPYGLDASTG